MLTKIMIAALGMIVGLMILRFLSGRAHRAELRMRSEARQRREEEASVDPGPGTRPDVPSDNRPDSRPDRRPDDKPNAVTTLEVDPDGVYRPKG